VHKALPQKPRNEKPPNLFSVNIVFLFATGNLYSVDLNVPALRCKGSEKVMCRQGDEKSVFLGIGIAEHFLFIKPFSVEMEKSVMYIRMPS
jgi:hypothetical protein